MTNIKINKIVNTHICLSTYFNEIIKLLVSILLVKKFKRTNTDRVRVNNERQ
jgi:hypothetical protein